MLEHRLGLIKVDINSNIERLTFELVLKDPGVLRGMGDRPGAGGEECHREGPDTRGVAVEGWSEVEAFVLK